MKGYIWFVDDDEHIRRVVQQSLELADYQVTTFASADTMLKAYQPDWPGIIITDINMPGISGIELMEQVFKLDLTQPVILLTGHGDISTAVKAMQAGAYDFIEKPFDSDLILDVVRRALEKRQLTLENQQLKVEVATQSAPGPRILGNNAAIGNLRRLIHQIMNTPTDILIEGETGTGKELIARYLHEHSNRAKHHFVAINCGAIPENLIESELFGHTAGAFTSAGQKRVGKLEYANGGTLFLDEIESMPLSLQIKLLRVLEERQVQPLGSNRLIDLDIRVVAATKEDLLAKSEQGAFRNDLYYRLNVLTIKIPSLRERLDDVLLLFQHFASIAAARYGREVSPLTTEQQQRLIQHDWPGNVRELRNWAERYVLIGDDWRIELPASQTIEDIQRRQTLVEKVERFEQALIEEALKQNQGSIKETMVCLGLPRKTLYDKMKKYGLTRKDYLKGY
ncbi:sigma-54-dependent transcriptional regulator [Spartinivicinus ruber]|uniref:sigma-54-dependent transcriptional regulator n=1 Tax=Spartinivicinus ruber TaxID=2683272 RepID=UPI0013D585B1|nr:sigma-54 dependent transcriptional regulator [Spartinivicinus ruber]